MSFPVWIMRAAALAGILLFLLFPGSGLSLAAERAPVAPSLQAGQRAAPAFVWRMLEPGLELGLAAFKENREPQRAAMFVVLRIDPALHEFSLCMASQSGEALSLAGWSERKRLRAGINAGMYLPDNLTSIGYMRSGGFVNNEKQGGRLGAFFVAGPKDGRLAPADIMDRDRPGWQKDLKRYDIVVQNYRLMNSRGELLWPEGETAHSIAAIAKDNDGRILFILSQKPLTVQGFARYLKSVSPDSNTVMYVEGGRQAGLFVRLDTQTGKDGSDIAAPLPGAVAQAVPGGVVHIWKGQQRLLNLPSAPEALLPNIIGIKIP